MAQYTIYTSEDASAPVLDGMSGSLVNVLNNILVTGYGSMHGAGWTKPLADVNGVGCFQQPTGSGAILFVGDGVVLSNEAKICGFTSITAMTNRIPTGSNPFPNYQLSGHGYGQYGDGGYLFYRKSATTTTASRQWIAFADSKSFHFHALTIDYAATYISFYFGDIDPVIPGDRGCCILTGRTTGAGTEDGLAILTLAYNASGNNTYIQRGYFINRSMPITFHGDSYKNVTTSAYLLGIVPYPNPVDDCIYMSPIWVYENAENGGMTLLRGKLRGMYHMCHAPSNFVDRQFITGSGDYESKSFQILKSPKIGSTLSDGVYTIEISNTMEY
jgi:hypothetical protein